MARLLIVDDEDSVLRTLATILTKSGHEVATASSGLEALAQFQDQEFEVVLIDLRMPEMDGQEVMQRLHDLRPEVPIIVVSGMGTKDDITQAMRIGCYDYLEKPIRDLDRLRGTVRRAAEQYQLHTREREHLQQLNASYQEQERQLRELRLLHEVALALQGTIDEGHLLRMVLTCATSGQALGYNRAHLFLVASDRATLRGTMAVGPCSGEDAGQIWQRLEPLSLLEQLELCKDGQPNSQLSRLISQVEIPLNSSDEIVARCVGERKAFVVHDAWNSPDVGHALAEAIRVNEFACAPLIGNDAVLGVLIVDNLITRRPIREDELRVLSTFANQTSLALATVQSYQRLRNHVQEIQRMQERLVESERLAAVVGVAAQVAHEIRNPLFVIGGYARRLSAAAKAESMEARVASIILEESDRLGQILTRVLQYLRETTNNLERCDLNQIIQQAVQSLHETIHEHGANLTLELGDLPQAELDPPLMEQVLVNLLLHALSATSGSDTIRVGTRHADDLIHLTVCDSGRGIPAADLPQLFNPFYTALSESTGVGLAVVNKIIHCFGGTVRVNSSEGQGTEIIVLLPPAGARDRVLAAKNQQ